jgi:hypothetical protein
MFNLTKRGKNMNDTQLKRIADALDEILRLVKLDQERSRKGWEYKPEEGKDE